MPVEASFQANDGVAIFVSIPSLRLRPAGQLSGRGHALLSGVHSSLSSIGVEDVAVSGDLLFAAARTLNIGTLSVWRVNAEAGRLEETMSYQNDTPDDDNNPVDGLQGAFDIALGGSNLLFVTGNEDDALSVWQVNETSGTLRQTAVYKNGDPNDGEEQVEGLDGAAGVVFDGDLLFVTGQNENALSVWRVNEAAGTLRQTAVYRDGAGEIDGLEGAGRMALSDNLLFVTGNADNALSAWRINALEGTLIQTDLHQDGSGIDGLGGASGIAVSGDGDSLFVTGNADMPSAPGG